MSITPVEALVILALIVVGVVLSTKRVKRNRRVRSGWNVPVRPVHDASCRSGWRAHIQNNHRY